MPGAGVAAALAGALAAGAVAGAVFAGFLALASTCACSGADAMAGIDTESISIVE
ncbi:hypothetical protein GCM10023157_24840 [Gluconacetobacter asukensis]